MVFIPLKKLLILQISKLWHSITNRLEGKSKQVKKAGLPLAVKRCIIVTPVIAQQQRRLHNANI